MLISIITITYNNLDGLKRTVDSVLGQSLRNQIEYVIIDGGSDDGTVEYLGTLPKEVRWISERDRGISHAFNKGLKYVTGDKILYLNSGDTFSDKKAIETVVADESIHNVDILSYKVIVDNDLYIPSKDSELFVWNECEEPHQATFVSSKVYQEIGGYSEEYRIRMDYHFFARCRKNGYSFKYIPQVIVKYEPGGVSMNSNNRIRFWEEGMSVKMLYKLKIHIKDIIKFLGYQIINKSNIV